MKHLLLVLIFVTIIITSGCISGENIKIGENLKITNFVYRTSYIPYTGQMWTFDFDVQNIGSVTEYWGAGKNYWSVKVLAYDKSDEFICSVSEIGRTLEPKEKTHYSIWCIGKSQTTEAGKVDIKIMR